MIYTIIDVETTGQSNRMTEISIFKFNGDTVIDEFTSLINPETYIPQHITALTGIDDHMVADAPRFAEVADDIINITEGAIFVAHNVNFDYKVISGEFSRIGLEFNRKKLCTVRLSRRLLPGHRILFELLLQQPEASDVFKEFLNKNSKEATLPPNLPKETFEALPDTAGIYYFKDKKGTVIYVGKAINIKKRVLSHFYSKTKKAQDMVRETRDIDFECSGSELIALLMEDAAIKHHFPVHNKVAKRTIQSFAIFSYEDRKGILHLASNKSRLVPNPIVTLFSIREVRAYLEKMCEKHNLCPKYCHLQESVSECSHFSIKNCKGICKDEEAVEDYNNRVLEAIHDMSDQKSDIIVREKGRHDNEEAFVMVKNGDYLGYRFVDKEETINHIDDLDTFLIPQKNNMDIQKILRSRLLDL